MWNVNRYLLETKASATIGFLRFAELEVVSKKSETIVSVLNFPELEFQIGDEMMMLMSVLMVIIEGSAFKTSGSSSVYARALIESLVQEEVLRKERKFWFFESVEEKIYQVTRCRCNNI